jgi:hypothetical protein
LPSQGRNSFCLIQFGRGPSRCSHSKLGIYEEFELMRHGKLRARCLDIFPNPPHVTCLTAIDSEDARFIRRDIIINPRTELVPRSHLQIKFVVSLELGCGWLHMLQYSSTLPWVAAHIC